jgi:radical SAM superfamily enzyme YgiQ (UPF0313 family)
VRHIVFYDDCLFIKGPGLEERVLEFAEALRAAGWAGTFQLELRCDAVVSLSDKALSTLIESGCRQINMGIEKSQPSQLKRLRKALVPAVASQACERLDVAGVRVAGTFIMGGPDEEEADLEGTVAFAESLALDFAQFNPLAVYPGTQLFAQVFGPAQCVDWLKLCLDRNVAPLGDILWSSPELPLRRILAWVAEAYRRFYSSERLERTLRKLPREERSMATESYAALAAGRARSWAIETGTVPQRVADRELPAC